MFHLTTFYFYFIVFIFLLSLLNIDCIIFFKILNEFTLKKIDLLSLQENHEIETNF